MLARLEHAAATLSSTAMKATLASEFDDGAGDAGGRADDADRLAVDADRPAPDAGRPSRDAPMVTRAIERDATPLASPTPDVRAAIAAHDNGAGDTGASAGTAGPPKPVRES
jgi:hypothetical protein